MAAATGRNCGKRGVNRVGNSALVFLLVALLAGALQRGTENVAKRCSGVRGAVLSDGLFLLGDFQRLDRYRHFACAPVDLSYARIDLLPDLEALGALIAAVARKIRAPDEGFEVGADELHVDA